MKINIPRLYISYMENGEQKTTPLYHTITPNGTGIVIGEDWTKYKVQDENLEFHDITINGYHTIFAKTE